MKFGGSSLQLRITSIINNAMIAGSGRDLWGGGSNCGHGRGQNLGATGWRGLGGRARNGEGAAMGRRRRGQTNWGCREQQIVQADRAWGGLE